MVMHLAPTSCAAPVGPDRLSARWRSRFVDRIGVAAPWASAPHPTNGSGPVRPRTGISVTRSPRMRTGGKRGA